MTELELRQSKLIAEVIDGITMQQEILIELKETVFEYQESLRDLCGEVEL